MAKAKPVRSEASPIVLRLDRSKKFSTVHGDRSLDDPHNAVAYIQDTLPYDAEGVLVPDDGKNAPWDVVIEGVRVRHFPLYTEAMRAKVARKIERAASGNVIDDVAVETEEDVPVDASEDVNLESWLRGEIKYQPFLIYAACKKRFSKQYTKLRDVVDDLVVELKIVPEEQVDPQLLRMLNPESA